MTYTDGYEPVGDIALLEVYLEMYQTDDDWDNWFKEYATLKGETL